MATNEKHRDKIKNEIPSNQAHELRHEAYERKQKTIRKMNNWWLWFGVLVLVAILIWWLFSMGLAEDAMGFINGN